MLIWQQLVFFTTEIGLSSLHKAQYCLGFLDTEQAETGQHGSEIFPWQLPSLLHVSQRQRTQQLRHSFQEAVVEVFVSLDVDQSKCRPIQIIVARTTYQCFGNHLIVRRFRYLEQHVYTGLVTVATKAGILYSQFTTTNTIFNKYQSEYSSTAF